MRKSKTFTNIFVSILLLSIGLVVSFGSYIYVTTTKSVIERVSEGHQSLILQMRNTLEQKFKPLNMHLPRTARPRRFVRSLTAP